MTERAPYADATHQASAHAPPRVALVTGGCGRDITVDTVAPGPTVTAAFDGPDQAPLDRPGSPDDIAEVVSLLAGPGRRVDGQVLHVNGGTLQ